MNNQDRIVILGAGHAGGTIASMLREQGFSGELTLVGNEPYLPYQRPPLSKAYIQGHTELDALLLKTADYYEERSIKLLIGLGATAIDRAAKRVQLDNGQHLDYDRLVIATGSRARLLPIEGVSLDHILALRTAQDAQRLQQLLKDKQHLVLIGGGYIGLETAASAVSMGLTVTVIERESRLLARVGSAALSDFFQHEHEKRGVRFLLSSETVRFCGTDQVETVHLSNGETLPCDIALIGAGVLPNMELASEAGLDCSNGIAVNIHAQTSDPAIYAIGDVSYRPLPLLANRSARVESVPNALEQARQATAHILGLVEPKPEVQWFWSDQYEYKLQIAGMAFDWDQEIVRGDPNNGKFSVLRLHNGILQSAECVNSPIDFIAAKQLIAAQLPLDAERLADTAVKLKEATLQPV
jgi:3-phenylpropionate/trans-cinnamate dioxygenase ferredoxin reductase subunit